MNQNNDMNPYNDNKKIMSLPEKCGEDYSSLACERDYGLTTAGSPQPALHRRKGGLEGEARYPTGGGERVENDEESVFESDFDKNTACKCCGLECTLCNACAPLSQHALGVILILCVAVIWVSASAWIQYIFGELEYEKPYFMTYFNTTGFSLWNLCYIFLPSWRRVPWNNARSSAPLIFTDPTVGLTSEMTPTRPLCDSMEREKCGPAGRSPSTSDNAILLESVHPVKVSETASSPQTAQQPSDGVLIPPPCKQSWGQTDNLKPYSMLKIFKCACVFCPFWFLANYLFNLSLSRTSIASNTVLSSTSSIWTLMLSVILLGQRLTLMKVGAVVLCVGGSAMIAFSDGKKSVENDSIIGDMLALVSAFFYAAYTSTLKWYLPEDERFHMGMAFGMVGVVNLFVFWPGLLIINAIGFEAFQLPTLQQFWPLVINTLIGTNLSDVLWARSVILTSPVVATLGLSLTTPLALVVDAVWKHQKFSPLYISGAVLVMIGFIFINLDFSGTSMERVRRFWSRIHGLC